MAIIVQPKTHAELNQLVSILNSTNRRLRGAEYMKVGGYFHTWKRFNCCDVHDFNVTGDVLTPVNELYAVLNQA